MVSSELRSYRRVNINRSTVYYKKRPIKSSDLEQMKLIDEQYLKTPSWGSRSMRNHLRRLGYKINRKRVQRLMRIMEFRGHPIFLLSSKKFKILIMFNINGLRMYTFKGRTCPLFFDIIFRRFSH